MRGATISWGMLPALARASSETADLVRRGGRSTLPLVLMISVATFGQSGPVGPPMPMPLFHPVVESARAPADPPRASATLARALSVFAIGAAVSHWMLVLRGMRRSSVTAGRGLRSLAASAIPCSFTPSSMLPALAAVVGGGRGGMGRRRRLGWLVPRASAIKVVRWVMRLASLAAVLGLRSWMASAHPRSSTPSSRLPAMAAVVGGGRGGLGRRPPLVWPAPRASLIGLCLPPSRARAIVIGTIRRCASLLDYALSGLTL